MTAGQSLLLQKLQPYKLKKVGPDKYKFLSPLREEENASAYLEFRGDNVLLYDQGFGEGSGDAILAKLGLTWPEVLPPRTEAPAVKPRIVAVYPYNEAPGVLRHDVVRFDPKDFRMRRPDGHGGHTWDCKGIERIPFMLPELVAAPRDLQRFIVEGEKDVLKLAGQGLIATTNPGGTGSTKLWDTKPFQEPFCDCDVVVLPDNDQAGAKHAAHVAASLASVARSIKVVNLPGLPPKGDVSDWLASGHTVEELRVLVAAAPLWTPEQAEPIAIDAELLPAPEYRFSESEASRRFGDQIRDRARFAADEGQWYYFNGQRYVKDHSGVWLLEQSLLVSRAYAEDGVRHGSNDPQFQARMAMAKAYNGLPGRKRLIELAKAEPGLAILSSQFDSDPWLLNCLTGTINLKSGQLQPRNPSDLITKLAPVNFDPSATCPRFDLFLVEVVTDLETIGFLQKAVGYTLTADVAEHASFFFYGPTRAGKTVFVELFQSMLGDYSVLAPTSLLMMKQGESHPCDRNVLKGVRLAVFTEMPAGQRWDLPTYKSLTGGDTITSRGMRENFSTFKPTAKLWMVGNHRPIVAEDDPATWERQRVIPIDRTIPEADRDPQLPEKLRAEMSGILNWAVAGCLAWQRERLGQSAKIRAATGAYREDSDRLAPFVAERCSTDDSEAVVKRSDLYLAYVAWATAQGERHPMSDRVFRESMLGHGFVECNPRFAGHQRKAWRGMRLFDTGDMPQTSHFPVKPCENSSRPLTGNSDVNPVSAVSAPAKTEAPDPMAQIGHCLRVRPGTTVTDADKQALVEHFAGLNGTANAVAGRLFDYWRANAAPTVSGFLAIETKGRAHHV